MSYWDRITRIEKRHSLPRGTTYPNRDLDRNREKHPIEKMEIKRAAKWWFGVSDNVKRNPLGIKRPSTSPQFQWGKGNRLTIYGKMK